MPEIIFEDARYDYKTLRASVFRILDRFAGAITTETRVLIKPNLLAPAPPERAMVTHPMIVRAAAEYTIEKGARPLIADSPAMGTFNRVLKEGGFVKALSGLDIECREFRESVSVDIGPPFNKIELSRDAVEADVIINLPKLKTHSQMLLTLGVKNLFGCVVGMRKPEWHFRTGEDRETFARLLVLICRTLNPAVTIMDGILAMEGQGPGKGGTPRELGVIIGAGNPFECDAAVCGMLGLDPGRLLTDRIAGEMGFHGPPLEMEGTIPAVTGFRLPEMGPLVFGPSIFHGLIRRHFVQRPEADKYCRLCGECWNYCPVGAIKKAKKKVSFDYGKCIRCYCCLEVCPAGAIHTAETMPGKILRKALRKH